MKNVNVLYGRAVCLLKSMGTNKPWFIYCLSKFNPVLTNKQTHKMEKANYQIGIRFSMQIWLNLDKFFTHQLPLWDSLKLVFSVMVLVVMSEQLLMLNSWRCGPLSLLEEICIYHSVSLSFYHLLFPITFALLMFGRIFLKSVLIFCFCSLQWLHSQYT